MNYMKKIAIAMVMTILMTISFSCSEDFLNKEPMGVTSENVFYNAKGIDAFTRLATQDNVLLAVGPTTSSVALAVIDLAAQYKIPLITPQATNTKITKEYGNEWFFRNSVADVYHSYTLADYIVKDLGL